MRVFVQLSGHKQTDKGDGFREPKEQTAPAVSRLSAMQA
jgi:hypothetical protein